MTTAVPKSRDDFEVAIVCALSVEANAVIATFDQPWDDQSHQLRPSLSEDRNEYTFGRIGYHNVVVLVLPYMGKKEASAAVAAMHPTFRNIQLCLVVGVCGVAPKNEDGSDIFLGDVIVSTYVIQSDLGRLYEDVFARRDTVEDNLGRPYHEVQMLLKRLELEHHHERLETRFRVHAEDLQRRKPGYAYPGKDFDHLYADGYTHMHRAPHRCNECKEAKETPKHVCAKARSASCAEVGCDTQQLVPRETLADERLINAHACILFGRFASGDQVIKSAGHRAALQKKEKIIGFETEGSGAWGHFPTIVLKSGCDYADSHKSKKWQKHCAGNAAACAKAVLEEWRPKDNVIEDMKSPHIFKRSKNPLKRSFNESSRIRVLPTRGSNPFFVGRTQELAEIERRFLESESGQTQSLASLAVPNIFIVEGLGGTGKSELCLRYMRLHDKRYWAIFWINGSTASSLESGLESIGRRFEIPGASAVEVYDKLASENQPWLLIVDNADDPDLDLSPYLPDQGDGHVLITTRNPHLDVFQTESALHLEGLTEDDALVLLFKTAGAKPQEQDSLTEVARDIINTLERHTLAVIQAGAYIRKTRDFDGYPQIFKDQKKLVLSYCAPQARSQYGSVYTTFEVSAVKLLQEAKDGQQHSADALHLLHLFAFMASRGSFERIFRSAKDYVEACMDSLDTESKSESEYRQVFETQPDPRANFCPSVRDVQSFARRSANLLSPLAYASEDLLGKHRWRAACQKLYQCSMVSFEKSEEEEEILVLHPLVLTWALARQSENDYRLSWFSVSFMVALAFHRERQDYNSGELNLHARACASHVSISWWTDKLNLPLLCLPYTLAKILKRTVSEASASSLICKCLEVGLEGLRQDQPESLHSQAAILTSLGAQAWYEGDTRQSIELFEFAIHLYGQMWTPPPISGLIDAKFYLGLAYDVCGQLLRSVQPSHYIIREVGDFIENYPGSWSAKEALRVAQFCIAQPLDQVKQPESAYGLWRTLHEAHPVRLCVEHRLACAYLSTGQTEKAMKLLEHVVQTKQKLPSLEQHSLVSSQFALAEAYLSKERTQNAVDLSEHIVRVRTSPTETSTYRLEAQNLLARAYVANGQALKAKLLLEQVAETVETSEKACHDHLETNIILASVYEETGQIERAENILKQVVEVRREIFPKIHRDLLKSQHRLATIYLLGTQMDKAFRLKGPLVKAENRVALIPGLDRREPCVLLTWIRQTEGHLNEAQSILQRVVEVRRLTFGETKKRQSVPEKVLHKITQDLYELAVDNSLMNKDYLIKFQSAQFQDRGVLECDDQSLFKALKESSSLFLDNNKGSTRRGVS